MAVSTVKPFPQVIQRDNIEAWLKQQTKNRTVKKIVWHHTWSPTKAQWQGAKHMINLKAFYERKGWRAGPHFFVAEDGIWPMTPINVQGIHAGTGNYMSIGIEVVGNYNNNKWSGKTLANAQALGKALHKIYKLPVNSVTVRMHRDYSNKTCPGTAITRPYIIKQLTADNMRGITDMEVRKHIQEVLRKENPSKADVAHWKPKMIKDATVMFKTKNWKKFEEEATSSEDIDGFIDKILVSIKGWLDSLKKGGDK